MFRETTRLLPYKRDRLLSHSGPILLIVIIVVWVILLLCGFALVIWPGLGSAIQASQGQTSMTFTTALYYSGYALATPGTGDLVPKTDGYWLLAVLEAALGFSIFTLTITYFLGTS